MANIDTVKAQLQTLLANRPGVNSTILYAYTPAFNHIHEILGDDEIINGYCIGSLTKDGKQLKAGKWLIISTNQQLVLLHKGSFTNLTHVEIPLAAITTVTTKFNWLSNKIKISDKTTDWELYNVNKTDLQFFEAAITIALSAYRSIK